MLELSIVIVNYNTCNLLFQCLASVFADLNPLSADVWVVDNASTDDSLEMVRRKYPQVQLVTNAINQGFARANNQAIQKAQGKTLVLLNPDTVIIPGFFSGLLNAFDTYPQVGMIVPKLMNPDQSIQPSWGTFSNAWTEFFFQFFLYKFFPSPFPLGQTIHPWQRDVYNSAHPVQWATGACLAVRKETVDKAGLLDESLFMYGEDMEWCWRIHQAGIPIWYIPTASLIHLARQSSRRDFSSWICRYTHGQLEFVRRHNTWIDLRLTCLMVVLGSAIRIIAWGGVGMIKRGRRNEAWQRVSGYFQAIKMGIQAFLGRSA